MSGEGYLEATQAARAEIETRAADLVDLLAGEHAPIQEAVSYALLGGGKRLRGVLCVLAHALAGNDARAAALDAACAIECVHAYSLVHDDLPCMDDDNWRRGKPSCHVEFGEATAVLVGDALLTLAFQILGSIPQRHPEVPAERVLAAIQVLADAAGTGGLITGQALDLDGHDGEGGVAAVERIHAHKTARLIAASIEVGAVLAGADMELRRRLRESGMVAGSAFQIVDDILDCEVDKETLGKTPGKDVQSDKLTYPALVGLDESRREAVRRIDHAKRLLPESTQAAALAEVFDFIVARRF